VAASVEASLRDSSFLRSPTTPLPPFLSRSEAGHVDSTTLSQKAKAALPSRARTPPRQAGARASSRERSLDVNRTWSDWDVSRGRDWSPNRSGTRATYYNTPLREHPPGRDKPTHSLADSFLDNSTTRMHSMWASSPLSRPGSRAASPPSWLRGTSRSRTASPAVRRASSLPPTSSRLYHSDFSVTAPLAPPLPPPKTEPLAPPLRTAPCTSPASSWRVDPKSGLVREALQTMMRQAELSNRIEDSKMLMPRNCSLEVVFDVLDRSRKGYVSDMDLWQLDQDFGGSAGFGSFCALVHELRLAAPRKQRDVLARPGQLSLRDVGLLLFPSDTNEHDAMRSAESDDEAKSILYLLKNSEPCPGCGMRVQRSADAAGCPSVTCPNCGTQFRCFVVVGDLHGHGGQIDLQLEVLSAAARYQLHRLVAISAHAAEELERDRKELAQQLAYDMCAFSDIFYHISGGFLSFSMSDLRKAFLQQGLPLPTERELRLLWHRYAAQGDVASAAAGVGFSDFSRQLQPHATQFSV